MIVVPAVRARSAGTGRLVAVGLTLVFATASQADPPTAAKPPSPRFDKDRLYLYQLHDFTRLKVGDSRDLEHQAYCDLVRHAHSFPATELAGAARKDVSYSNLMAVDDRLREDVRFELIELSGRLKRLKRIGTFPELAAAGVEQVYEAWVFPDGRANPVCFHLTDLPAGIEPQLDITPGRQVRASGYFFKVVTYQSDEANPKSPGQNLYRRAPLLIGRSLEEVSTLQTGPENSGLRSLLPVVLAGVGGVILVIGLMAVWLRRTDAGVRAYARRASANPFDRPATEAGDH